MAVFQNPALPAPLIRRVSLDGRQQTEYGSRSSMILTIVIVSQAVITLFFLLRLLSRTVILRIWKLDDYLLSIAYALSLSTTGLSLLGIHYGVGQHIETVSETNLVKILKIDYGIRVVCVLLLCMAKLSMCALYIRVFPSSGIGRFAIIFCATFIILFFLAVEFVTIFPCIPVSSIWSLLSVSKRPGMCLNLVAEYYISGVSNFFSDLWLLAVVLPKIMMLRIHLAEKVLIFVVLLIGGFSTILASLGRAIRMVSIIKTPNADRTWMASDVYLWTQVGICVTILCACVPTLRPVYRWLVPESMRSGPIELKTEEDHRPIIRSGLTSRNRFMSMGRGPGSKEMSRAGWRASFAMPGTGNMMLQLPPRIFVMEDTPVARPSPRVLVNRPSFSPNSFANLGHPSPLSSSQLSPMSGAGQRRQSSYFPLQPVPETSKEAE